MKNMNRGGLVLDQNLLKWIAVITMTIDHAGMILFPQADVMRLIGRLAFPIYCYLLVQGFIHTKSRAKYMGRLAVFCVLSELPFDLACYGVFSWRGQSVFLTLFVCLGMLWLMERALFWNGRSMYFKICLAAAAVGLAAALTHICSCDYGFSAPFLVAGLYLYVRKDFLPAFCPRMEHPYGAFVIFLCAMFAGWLLEGVSAEGAANGVLTESFCLPSAWLMEVSSSKRFRKGGKYFFYLYYPLHLLILYGIGRLY